MSNPFQKASRSQVYLKLGITGPTGSGKTYSALRLAFGLVAGTDKRVAFLDTENDSASLYSDSFDFDVLPISPPFEAESFRDGVRAAMDSDYGVVIIDSASHLWKGILEYKGSIDARGGNQYTNWREPDRKFQEAIDAVLQSRIHAIFCMRSKMEYVMEDNGKGKQAPKKVGLAPIMRDGIEFEFTTVFDVAMNHEAASSKDRSGLFPNDKYFQITEKTGQEIAAWLMTATPKPEPRTPAVLTDDERKAGLIGKYRDEILKKSTDLNYEPEFCRNGSALHEDARERTKLEDYTLQELRDMWGKRATLYKMTDEKLNGVAKP